MCANLLILFEQSRLIFARSKFHLGLNATAVNTMLLCSNIFPNSNHFTAENLVRIALGGGGGGGGLGGFG